MSEKTNPKHKNCGTFVTNEGTKINNEKRNQLTRKLTLPKENFCNPVWPVQCTHMKDYMVNVGFASNVNSQSKNYLTDRFFGRRKQSTNKIKGLTRQATTTCLRSLHFTKRYKLSGFSESTAQYNVSEHEPPVIN